MTRRFEVRASDDFRENPVEVPGARTQIERAEYDLLGGDEMPDARLQGVSPPQEDDTVTASEVAAYAYCAKAWHLEHVLGNRGSAAGQARRDSGSAAHREHGRRIERPERSARLLFRLAIILLTVALILVVAALSVGV